MQESTYFHESYYDHSCTIVPEQDVLQTDIIGNGIFQRLSRWWHGLFLLSYNDQRSRVYYTSSHSIRVDRTKQFRRYKKRIHPLSDFRNFWDCMLIWVIMVNHVLFHHNTSMLFGQFSPPFYYISVVLEIFVILDLFVNFKTGYIDTESKQIILDANRGIMQYCSTKLFLHCASAMPLQFIMFLRYGTKIDCIRCKSNKFICALKLLSLFRLKRIYEASRYWNRDRGSFKVTHIYNFLRIFVLGFATMLQFLDLSDMLCLWIILRTDRIDEASYFSLQLKRKYINSDPSTNLESFCHDCSRICKSLLLFSFGYLRSTYCVDKITSVIAYLIANIFYLWSILECYTVISRLKFLDDRVLLNKSTSMNFMISRQIPDDLNAKVMQYHDLQITKLRNIENQNGLFTSLPKILKKEAVLSCYKRRLVRVPCFNDWSPNIIEELVLLLSTENYLEGDVVSQTWVQGDGLIIIDVGVMAVYSPQNEELGHLIDGDSFGELSLVTDKEVRTSSVVAVTSCKILLLPKTPFRNLMRHHTQLFYDLKRRLQDSSVRTFSTLEESTRSTDTVTQL